MKFYCVDLMYTRWLCLEKKKKTFLQRNFFGKKKKKMNNQEKVIPRTVYQLRRIDKPDDGTNTYVGSTS